MVAAIASTVVFAYKNNADAQLPVSGDASEAVIEDNKSNDKEEDLKEKGENEPIDETKDLDSEKNSDEDDEKIRLVDFVTGACFLIRREAVQQVGLLDEKFFMYLEDADWCLRVKQAGWKICIYEGAQVIHRVGETFRQGGDITSLERCKSRYYYFQKHHSRKSILLLKVITTSTLLLRGGGLLLLYLLKSSRERAIVNKRLKSYGKVIKLSLNT